MPISAIEAATNVWGQRLKLSGLRATLDSVSRANEGTGFVSFPMVATRSQAGLAQVLTAANRAQCAAAPQL
jgi:hypothetical protein